jgi:hypothetical protein
VILIICFYEKSGLFKIILVKCCSVNNIFIDPNIWTCHASEIVQHEFSKSSMKFRIYNYHPTSAPYSIFIFHSFTINFLQRNGPYWARASSLSRLHNHTQTCHTQYVSYGQVISLMQRPLPHKHTTHTHDTDIQWPPMDSNPQFHQASGNRPVC